LPPSRIADTSFARAAASGSISSAIKRRSTNVPWEWPIKTTPRPSFSFCR
jgi:hypothetical protein